MTIARMLLLSAAMLSGTTGAVTAGPCTDAIDRAQARVDTKAEAANRTWHSAPQSAEALMHRQPTRDSITAAQTDANGLSPGAANSVSTALARARIADRNGDRTACERSVTDAQRAIGP